MVESRSSEAALKIYVVHKNLPNEDEDEYEYEDEYEDRIVDKIFNRLGGNLLLLGIMTGILILYSKW